MFIGQGSDILDATVTAEVPDFMKSSEKCIFSAYVPNDIILFW